jgi:hypothetical protein
MPNYVDYDGLFMFLCQLAGKIWALLYLLSYGGHLGRHLVFLKLLIGDTFTPIWDLLYAP